MAKFVKCVCMCELECWGMVLRSPVYSACGVVVMLRRVGWCTNIEWHGWSGFALAVARKCVLRMLIWSCNVSTSVL